MQLPDLPLHFVRLTISCKDTRGFTPGGIAQRSGLRAEQLGIIIIAKNKVIVDVHENSVDLAKAAFAKLGNINEKKHKSAPIEWFWLTLGVGRNHGLTMGQLRKVFNRAGAPRLGKIEVANTHAKVGISAPQIEGVLAALADVKINGFPLKPTVSKQADIRAGLYGTALAKHVARQKERDNRESKVTDQRSKQGFQRGQSHEGRGNAHERKSWS